jgi:Na+/glutamate symporter
MENKMNTTDTVLILCGLSSAVVIGLILYYFLRKKPDMEGKSTQNKGGKEKGNEGDDQENSYKRNVIHKLRFLFFFLAFLIFVMVLFSGLAYFGTLGYV